MAKRNFRRRKYASRGELKWQSGVITSYAFPNHANEMTDLYRNEMLTAIKTIN